MKVELNDEEFEFINRFISRALEFTTMNIDVPLARFDPDHKENLRKLNNLIDKFSLVKEENES